MNQGQEQPTNAKILIVDDTAISRKLLAKILRREKYEVYEAINGVLGLEMAQLTSPDLILLDICMPGLDGHAVCKQLKQQPETRNTPIIFVTASMQQSDRAKAIVSGGADYITKPFAIPTLKSCVAHHLQSQALPVQEDAAITLAQKPLDEKMRREGWLIPGGIVCPHPLPAGL